MQDDPGRYGRCTAVDGRAYTMPCKTPKEEVLLLYTKNQLFSHQIQANVHHRGSFIWE